MPRLSKDRIALTRGFLQSFDRLQRKDGTEVEWIMLKLSCKEAEAVKLVTAARATMTPPTPPPTIPARTPTQEALDQIGGILDGIDSALQYVEQRPPRPATALAAGHLREARRELIREKQQLLAGAAALEREVR